MGQDSDTKHPDEQLLFTQESGTVDVLSSDHQPQKLKLLIIDDEKEVHVMTKLVLSDYSFKNYTLDFYSAYSAIEAKGLIRQHPDAALILLDVVMETKTAGLDIARFIRKQEKNSKLRIILRTGQPGKAPENDIILNYDINDYKEKTELTSQKLFTTITTALRSYLHLLDLEKKTVEIENKNNQLNDEVARRIVAESNLTKYNRSLEKMIENKGERLKTAIKALRKKEKELEEANLHSQIGQVSSASLSELNFSGQTLKDNLSKINTYRSDMTILLDKYQTLQDIISQHSKQSDQLIEQTHEAISMIDQYKKEIDFETILNNYPEIIKDSAKGIDYISRAISDIRLFISINDDIKEKTDINTLLEQVAQELKMRFNKSIDLQLNLGEIPNLQIGVKNIKKAFHEIIKNAFEAVESQGIVSIATCSIEPDISIDIRDIGTGISPDDITKVFKPYFTTKEDAQGLGLAFAKSVITSNRGKIDIESTLDEGSHVTIRLSVSG